MIIEPITKTDNGITFKEITHSSDFWAVGYDSNKLIKLFTPEERPLSANTFTASVLDGFGATSYEDLMQEIAVRELVWPEG
ncbi:MAG: hypothetical protein ABJG41_10065 [Cyclobacteriaceae bacterium]